jgi:hypothetical protein
VLKGSLNRFKNIFDITVNFISKITERLIIMLQYEEFAARLHEMSQRNIAPINTWRVENVQKNMQGVDMVLLLNKGNNTKQVMPVNEVVKGVYERGCYITNPSALQHCSVFKKAKAAGPVVVKLTVTTEMGNETDYLKIKTPDGKTKKEIEGILYEASKVAERLCTVRGYSQLGPMEQKMYDLYQLYGYTIDFFVDYMTKLLGWTVEFMDFDICVELR